jgi:hypothetical protein
VRLSISERRSAQGPQPGRELQKVQVQMLRLLACRPRHKEHGLTALHRNGEVKPRQKCGGQIPRLRHHDDKRWPHVWICNPCRHARRLNPEVKTCPECKAAIPRLPYLAPGAIRFWRKVDKSGDCWLWRGGTSRKGDLIYGAFGLGGPDCSAHRASWILSFGPVPPGLLVCHECDTPLCVRPTHLFLGTYQDNVDDMIRKGRGSWQRA